MSHPQPPTVLAFKVPARPDPGSDVAVRYHVAYDGQDDAGRPIYGLPISKLYKTRREAELAHARLRRKWPAAYVSMRRWEAVCFERPAA